MRKINKIIVHHTESPGGDVEFVRHIHVDINKWSDVGYHFVITNGKSHGSWNAGGDGEIQEGRPMERMGAHAKGANKGSVGISLVGTFDETEPTSKQVASVCGLIATLCNKFNLDPRSDVLGHRDVGNTDCPGDNLYALLPTIREVAYKMMAFIRLTAERIKNAEDTE